MEKIILFLSCFLAVIADMMLVWYAKHQDHPVWAYVSGIFLILISTIIWTYSMKMGIESATAIVFYAVFTTIGCAYLGFIIFNESVSILNISGIVLGIISLIMISI